MSSIMELIHLFSMHYPMKKLIGISSPFAKDKKIIGWIGRLDKRKNWPMLLEIAKVIKQERDDIEIWIIGGAQSIQRDEFAEIWKEEQLTDIIKWFPVIPYQKCHMFMQKYANRRVHIIHNKI